MGDLPDTKALSQGVKPRNKMPGNKRVTSVTQVINLTGRGASLYKNSDSTLHSAKALSRLRIACRYPIYVPEWLMLKPQNAALVLPHFDLIYFFLRFPPRFHILLCPIDMAFCVSDLCRG